MFRVGVAFEPVAVAALLSAGARFAMVVLGGLGVSLGIGKGWAVG